jgi:sugar lactone lactonase YvrE
MTTIDTLDDGLFLPESPRWHDGRLWLSDILHRSVIFYDADGRKHTYAVFDDDPSGLGWDADGNLLAVGMRDRRLLRVTDDGMRTTADLSGLEAFMLKDMAVSSTGTAFITRFGSNIWQGEPLVTVRVIRVTPAGRAEPGNTRRHLSRPARRPVGGRPAGAPRAADRSERSGRRRGDLPAR